jgi:hypothetical protein
MTLKGTLHRQPPPVQALRQCTCTRSDINHGQVIRGFLLNPTSLSRALAHQPSHPTAREHTPWGHLQLSSPRSPRPSHNAVRHARIGLRYVSPRPPSTKQKRLTDLVEQSSEIIFHLLGTVRIPSANVPILRHKRQALEENSERTQRELRNEPYLCNHMMPIICLSLHRTR